MGWAEGGCGGERRGGGGLVWLPAVLVTLVMVLVLMKRPAWFLEDAGVLEAVRGAQEASKVQRYGGAFGYAEAEWGDEDGVEHSE